MNNEWFNSSNLQCCSIYVRQIHENGDILNLAASYGLQLRDDLRFNEMGIDFRAVFARDQEGNAWILRIPRRENLDAQVQRELEILNLVKRHLSVSVPDWKIASQNLIAYPMLENSPIITYDSITREITWNIDEKGNRMASSLARVLHQYAIFALRTKMDEHINTARIQLGIRN